MPHILLETTSDLSENAHVPDILEALISEIARHPSIDPKTTKAYHSLRSIWWVGEGHPPGLAHCTLKVLTGKSSEELTGLADAVFRVLNQQFSESLELGEVAITLEVVEMNRELYRR